MSLCWLSSSKTPEAGGETPLSPSHLLTVRIAAVDKIFAIVTQVQKTHSSSLLCMIPIAFPCVAIPLQRVDMKSLRTNTEVGIIVHNFSSMCIKEQQQHADVSCVWSRRLVLFTREQRRRSNTLSIPASPPPVWLSSVVFRGKTKTAKTTSKPVISERCFR